MVILRVCDKGPAVEMLQIMLLKCDYNLLKYRDDGFFGEETLRAVKRFQCDAGIKVDGIVGTDTWNALYRKFLPCLRGMITYVKKTQHD